VDRGRQPFFLRYFLTLRCVVVVVVTSRARVDDDGAKGAKGAMAMAMHSPASRVKTMWRRERRETRDDDETMASMRIDAQRDGSDLEADLKKVCTAYIDDIGVASSTIEEHQDALEKILQRLHMHGIQLRFDKSDFFVTQMSFLGYLIDASSDPHATLVRPNPSKLAIDGFYIDYNG
jgi:hypothetical protein